MHKLSVIAAIFLLLIGGAAADDWDIDVLNQPHNYEFVTNNSSTVQMVNITAIGVQDDPYISKPDLEGDWAIEYEYNGESSNMTWYKDGLWYADFDINGSDFVNQQINFTAYGETNDSNPDQAKPPAYELRNLTVGDLDVELEDDLSEKKVPGRWEDIAVNVTDTVNEVDEENATVYIQFTDGNWTSSQRELIYESEEGHEYEGLYYRDVQFPEEPNSSFVYHVYAENSDKGVNFTATNSGILQTYPEVKGEVQTLETNSGCNNSSFFTECESGAEIDLEFGITAWEADKVNMTMLLENSTSGEEVLHDYAEMEGDGETFSANFTFPEINTTRYSEIFTLRFNATKEGNYITEYEIEAAPFILEDRTTPTTTQGSTHEIRLLAGKAFSKMPLESDYFKSASVEVTDPSGETVTSYTLEDMELDPSEDLYINEVQIAGDAETGTYSIDAEMTDIYNNTDQLSSGFTVESINQTFNVTGENTLFIPHTGDYTETLELENLLDQEIELQTELTGEMSDMTEVSDTVTVGPEETTELTLDHTVESVDNYDGELKLTHESAGYDRTVDLALEAPEYDIRDGEIAVRGTTDNWLNVTAFETGTINREIEVIYMGGDPGEGETVDADISLSGDITEYLSTDSVISVRDSETLELSYDVTDTNTHTGTITIEQGEDELEFNTGLDGSDVEIQNPGVSIPSSIDLGYIKEGSDVEQELEVENTGETEISQLEVSSDEFDVEIASTEIAAGETESVNLDFTGVDEESGSITVTAETSAEEVTDTADVEVTFVDGMESDIEDLRDRVTTLSINAEDQDTQEQVQDLELQLSTLENEYYAGNYEPAFSEYEDIEQTVETLEEEVDITSGSTGDTGNSTENPDEPEQPDDSGGAPILPIALGLGVLLLIGFVAYESVIPEEGDPLYDVLGK